MPHSSRILSDNLLHSPMADYYELIAKAIAGLDASTGRSRYDVYAHARTALVRQLTSLAPPLTEAQITRERLSLEEAIRSVEARVTLRRAEASPKSVQQDTTARQKRPNGSASEMARLSDRQVAAPRGEVAGVGAGRSREEKILSSTGMQNRVGHPAPITPTVSERPQRPAGAVKSAVPRAVERNREGSDHRTRPPDMHVEARDRIIRDTELATDKTRSFSSEASAVPTKVVRHTSRGKLLVQALAGVSCVVVVVLGFYWQSHGMRALPIAKLKIIDDEHHVKNQVDSATERTDLPGAIPASGAVEKVVLYDEDPTNAKGTRYFGSAQWGFETAPSHRSQKSEPVIRAQLEIPERALGITILFWRDLNAGDSAHYTVEIIPKLPIDFAFGGISQIPGILMKDAEETYGDPLAGLAVKPTADSFRIQLASGDPDGARNVQLLKQRTWFDIPIIYKNGRRAILAVEKGGAGQQAFQQAFAAWGG